MQTVQKYEVLWVFPKGGGFFSRLSQEEDWDPEATVEQAAFWKRQPNMERVCYFFKFFMSHMFGGWTKHPKMLDLHIHLFWMDLMFGCDVWKSG